MSVALFVENLGAFPADRCRHLNERLRLENLKPIEAVYALTWPDYKPPHPPRPQENREAFGTWRNAAGVPLWSWMVCAKDQAMDAQAIDELEAELDPDGHELNIEKPLQEAKLEVVCKAAADTGKPRRASLAGGSPANTPYDYRALERYGFDVDWQAYFDSHEGPTPDSAVAELYQTSFVVPGWEYRHRVGAKYGWGSVRAIEHEELAVFNSYLRPGQEDSRFGVLPMDGWAWRVDDRILWPENPDRPPCGLLMGRAAYPRIRVTLDVTRTAQFRPAVEWTGIAASARVPGARKRSISVYLAENDPSCDRIMAIARGAA